MSDLLTIIYYSSNHENPEFEKKVTDNILSVCGDTPIISVTHNTMNFGKNICVGRVGRSDNNVFRQIMIGCEAANTPFIATSEADCLYPPGYYGYIPEDINMAYRNTNLFIHSNHENGFRRKDWSTCSMFSGREYLIGKLKLRLNGFPEWIDCRDYKYLPPELIPRYKDIFEFETEWKLFHSDFPVINFKTGCSMRYFTDMRKRRISRITHWGTFEEVKHRMGLK
jgi:hypothetical protein